MFSSGEIFTFRIELNSFFLYNAVQLGGDMAFAIHGFPFASLATDFAPYMSNIDS